MSGITRLWVAYAFWVAAFNLRMQRKIRPDYRRSSEALAYLDSPHRLCLGIHATTDDKHCDHFADDHQCQPPQRE